MNIDNTLYFSFVDIYSGINSSILILSITSIIFGLLVINTNNPVISVLYLIVLFVNLAIYLLLFGYTFIGLSLIIVYVGAIAILFLFVIMLLDISAPSEMSASSSNNIDSATNYKNYYSLTVLLLFIMILPIYNVINHLYNDVGNAPIIFIPLLFLLYNISSFIQKTSPSMLSHNNNDNDILTGLGLEQENMSSASIYEHLDYVWNNNFISIDDIQSLGYVIYSVYPLSFYLIGLLLLISMIGSIIISNK